MTRPTAAQIVAHVADAVAMMGDDVEVFLFGCVTDAIDEAELFAPEVWTVEAPIEARM